MYLNKNKYLLPKFLDWVGQLFDGHILTVNLAEGKIVGAVDITFPAIKLVTIVRIHTELRVPGIVTSPPRNI